MTQYLITFPSDAMNHIPDEEMPEVARAAHAVCQEIIDAGAYVATGGLEDEPASLVGPDGTVTEGPRPDFIGGVMIVDVPSREDALTWAGKIAAACRCPQEVRAIRFDPELEAMLGKAGSTRMKMKVELIPLPVSDVDRSIAFYADQLGFTKDVDVQPSGGVRVVQLTPLGSGCSVGFGTGLDVYAGEPGSVRGVHLVVEDIAAARAELVRRGVPVGEIQDFGGGVKGANFSDPDGNTFELQEMAWRTGATY